MKIVHVGAITTGIVIILGIAMIIPAFMRTTQPVTVLLSFDIVDEKNIPTWCHDLSSILKKYNVKAAVFVTGKIAEQHPDCVTVFPKNVDIGSETYNYVSLPSIPDYSVQLDEIKTGKMAVDKAGNIDSKLFRAPYESTDQNIYSLLNSSDILADFSYEKQYNKYYEGHFIKFDLISYNGTHFSYYFNNLSQTTPVRISFDNSIPIQQIDDAVSRLKTENIRFVSATELTSLTLTAHEEKKICLWIYKTNLKIIVRAAYRYQNAISAYL